MLLLLLQTIWLGLPAALSNIAPPIATKLFPKASYPIDCYKKLRNRRILGDNKTIRGFIAGVLVGELTFLLQQFLSIHGYTTHSLEVLSYATLPWFFGFLFGIGALGGDMVKSFFKRQIGIPAGKTWFPFDQIDWLLGTIVILLLFVPIPAEIIIVGLLFGGVGHIVVKAIGFFLGIDKEPI